MVCSGIPEKEGLVEPEPNDTTLLTGIPEQTMDTDNFQNLESTVKMFQNKIIFFSFINSVLRIADTTMISLYLWNLFQISSSYS